MRRRASWLLLAGALSLWAASALAGWGGVTKAIVDSGKFEHAAVYGRDGKRWAETEGFGLKPAEVVAMAKAIDNGAIDSTPIQVAGETYALRSGKGGEYLIGKREGRLAILHLAEDAKDGKAIVIALSKKYESDATALAVVAEQARAMKGGQDEDGKDEPDAGADGGEPR
jgi:hypothetical protein